MGGRRALATDSVPPPAGASQGGQLELFEAHLPAKPRSTQLALALLLDHTGDEAASLHWHQSLKHDEVSRWQGNEWTLPVADLDRWMRRRPQ